MFLLVSFCRKRKSSHFPESLAGFGLGSEPPPVSPPTASAQKPEEVIQRYMEVVSAVPEEVGRVLCGFVEERGVARVTSSVVPIRTASSAWTSSPTRPATRRARPRRAARASRRAAWGSSSDVATPSTCSACSPCTTTEQRYAGRGAEGEGGVCSERRSGSGRDLK